MDVQKSYFEHKYQTKSKALELYLALPIIQVSKKFCTTILQYEFIKHEGTE